MLHLSSCHRRIFEALIMATALGCSAGNHQATEPRCPDVHSASAAGSTANLGSSSTAPPGSSVDAVAAELVKRINVKDGKGVVALYGASMREALPEAKTGPFVAGIVDDVGTIVSFERVAGSSGERDGKYRVKAERGELRLELHVDREGKVTGLTITNAPPPDPLVAKSTIPLVLPFQGQWSVFWGGDKPELNQHIDHHSQRRAADLVMVGPDGKTHRGDGKKNEDYFAYGQDIVAVADGVIVTVIDGVPENAPGSLNPYSGFGNGVIVKHSDSLYSAYAHLQPGKTRVQVGARVRASTVLGLCGNAGNSSEPHLHFQLQDGPRIEDSWGVEPVFNDVALVRQGKSTRPNAYTFLKGDLVGEPARSTK
jgi:murein DD-endopeptidase MepM/ murein hydrolase activator NlpD